MDRGGEYVGNAEVLSLPVSSGIRLVRKPRDRLLVVRARWLSEWCELAVESPADERAPRIRSSVT